MEPKLLGGEGHEAAELRDRVEELRQKRGELPALHLDQVAAAEKIEKHVEREIARIEKERDEQLSILDRLIEKTRELAAEVKERATEIARNVAKRVESFFGAGERGALADQAPAKDQEQARPPTLSVEELMEQKLSALDRQMALQEAMDVKLAALDQRMEAEAKAQQEKERSREQELSRQGHSRGLGIER